MRVIPLNGRHAMFLQPPFAGKASTLVVADRSVLTCLAEIALKNGPVVFDICLLSAVEMGLVVPSRENLDLAVA